MSSQAQSLVIPKDHDDDDDKLEGLEVASPFSFKTVSENQEPQPVQRRWGPQQSLSKGSL